MQRPGNFPKRGNGTFLVSCGVLASMAVAQFLTAWTGWRQQSLQKTAVAEVPVKPPSPQSSLPSATLLSPPLEAPVVQADLSIPPEPAPLAGESAHSTIPPTQQPPPNPASEPTVVSLDVPLNDPAILEHLEKGLFLREKGDLVTAIGEFRAAWQLLPDHPRLIYQLATTLDQLGLEHKSTPLWRSLADLGPAAGDYQKLVPERIATAGPISPDAGPVAPLPDVMEKHITIEKNGANHDKTITSGERQVVQFQLAKHTAESIDVANDLALVLHFFEEVNGRRIARAELPEVPTINFLELPLEWEGGNSEPAEGIYFQPTLSPQEILKFGQRKFYGYVLEVFWKGKLQDRRADPPDLANFAREMPISESPTPGTDVNSASAEPPPPGVDASLFPRPN